MHHERSRGMTLIELCVVVVVMGIVIAMGIPALGHFNQTHQMRGAAENIAAQLRLARSTAIITGVKQRFHFYAGYSGYDYHIHSGGGGVKIGWNLPKNVSYEWGDDLVGIDLTPDGHASDQDNPDTEPRDVVLVDNGGARDTVSVQLSGFILVR